MAQHKYFSKDESLRIKGITVYFKHKDSKAHETCFYYILSTEKTQDGTVVFANAKIMLDHIDGMLDKGAVVKEMKASQGLK